MTRIPIIIDCDTGTDDAIAIIVALTYPQLDIKGITTIGGNSNVTNTTNNTLKVLELCKVFDVPVVAGRTSPLLNQLLTSKHVHGESGMGDSRLPEPKLKPLKMSAVEFIADQVEKSKTKMVLVAVGPFTNIGVFLLAYPHLHHKIEKIHVMGGGVYEGNRSQLGEANIMNDPEAAYVIANCGIPVHYFGLDVTHRSLIYKDEFELFSSHQGPIFQFVNEMLKFRANRYIDVNGWNGVPAHDVCAVASLIDPTLFVGEEAYINIDLDGTVTRGACVVDLRAQERRLGKNNGVFYMDVERKRFLNLILDSCRILEERMKN
jgi:pyrimidine-specific ribonucleoside hydrolase